MEIIIFLSIVIAVVAVLTSIVLVRRIKKQIAEMTDALVDVKNGNGNRRILSATNELTAPLFAILSWYEAAVGDCPCSHARSGTFNFGRAYQRA